MKTSLTKVELEKKREFDYLKECVTTFMKTNDRLDMSQFFDQGLAFGLDFADKRINIFGEYYVFHIDYKVTSNDKKIWLGYSVSTINK